MKKNIKKREIHHLGQITVNGQKFTVYDAQPFSGVDKSGVVAELGPRSFEQHDERTGVPRTAAIQEWEVICNPWTFLLTNPPPCCQESLNFVRSQPVNVECDGKIRLKETYAPHKQRALIIPGRHNGRVTLADGTEHRAIVRISKTDTEIIAAISGLEEGPNPDIRTKPKPPVAAPPTKPNKPNVTFSDNFKTVMCTSWPKSESRQRARQATAIMSRLYENWKRGNTPLPFAELRPDGKKVERLDKELDAKKYPRAFALLVTVTNEKTGLKTAKLSDDYEFKVT